MKKGVGFFCIILSCLFLVSSAISEEAEEKKDIFMTEFMTQFQGQELPEFAKRLFYHERINIHITGEEAIVIGIITDKGMITTISEKLADDPTLNVYATTEVIENIMAAENPLIRFQQALQQKEIRYAGVGIAKKIKFSALSFFPRITGLFTKEIPPK
ncbi:hypothetical protein J4228_00070 [Candidatus Woesearchaeota archaeon]|nr:hypothetical protein [Candidatus Woesearchaeota archaeon]